MNVKAFRRMGEHARSRPLVRPKADLSQNPFLASDQFAEQSALALRVNITRENFDAGNPGLR